MHMLLHELNHSFYSPQLQRFFAENNIITRLRAPLPRNDLQLTIILN